MIWLVRIVVKTYEIGAWGFVSVKILEVNADSTEEAKVLATKLIEQQEKKNHHVYCTAVFEKGCQLHEFNANVTYMSTDEFDDHQTEGLTTSFRIQAPGINEAEVIAEEEAKLHLHQYAYFRGVKISQLD